MRKVTEVLRYDGATVDQVHEMLATPAFREEVCDFQRVIRKAVAIETDGDGMSVRIEMFHNTDRVPSFAKKIVGGEIHIIQAEEWRSKTHGDIHLEVPNRPGRMHGTAIVTEDADGVTETVDLTIEVHIPLIGGKIEGLIGEMFSKAMRAEQKVGRDWLARG